MTRDYNLLFKDIVEAIKKIDEFIGDMNYAKFAKDDKTSSAVARKIEIIGEAAKNIPAQLRRKHPQIPWSDMAKMRDKTIHFYFGVDNEIVWKVCKDRLPAIRLLIEQILKESK